MRLKARLFHLAATESVILVALEAMFFTATLQCEIVHAGSIPTTVPFSTAGVKSANFKGVVVIALLYNSYQGMIHHLILEPEDESHFITPFSFLRHFWLENPLAC